MRKSLLYTLAVIMIALGFLQLAFTYLIFPDFPTLASLVALSGCLILFEACLNMTCISTYGRLSKRLTSFSSLLILLGGGLLITSLLLMKVGNGKSFPQSGKLGKHSGMLKKMNTCINPFLMQVIGKYYVSAEDLKSRVSRYSI